MHGMYFLDKLAICHVLSCSTQNMVKMAISNQTKVVKLFNIVKNQILFASLTISSSIFYLAY